MANLSKVIYINEVDYSTLLNGGTITKGGVTYSHDPTALYVIKNVSAPEYAETAGYATTAGQATKATQDGDGNVIKETYAKKVVIGNLSAIEDQNTGNLIGYSCDKTLSELLNAYKSGRQVLLYENDYRGCFLYLNDVADEDSIEDCGLYFYSLPNSDGEILKVSISRENNADKIYYSTQYITDGYATESYVTTAVSNLVGSAPQTLNTLNELAAALGNDANFSTTVTNAIANKQDKPIGFLGWSETYFNDWQDFPEDEADARELTSSEAAAIQDIHQNAWNREWCFEYGMYPMTYSWNGEDANTWTVLSASGDTVGVMSWVLHYNSDNKYWFTQHQSEIATTDIFATVATSGSYADLSNKPTIPTQLQVGSVAGKLYRDDVNGGGNFTVKGNSGCIPNLTAGTFIVSIYAKSETQSYTFRFNFGSVSYDLSTTNSEINDVREITIPSDGTFSGSVLNGSVAPGTILYVVMYDYLTPVSTVGIAAVTNNYSDLDNKPSINNGTLTIQQNGITVGTFTANQSSNTTANIYSTMFGTLGHNGFERDNYNSTGGWAGVEIVTPDPLVTYIDILSNKLYRYDPPTSRYIELSEGDLNTITSTAITDLTDIL